MTAGLFSGIVVVAEFGSLKSGVEIGPSIPGPQAQVITVLGLAYPTAQAKRQSLLRRTGGLSKDVRTPSRAASNCGSLLLLKSWAKPCA